ncbi:hypothetical protein C8Q79DRAFT_886077, partial [Trametes meyenii]
LPQCPSCWSWGHTPRQCRAQGDVCVRCGESHDVRMHDLFASCCRDRVDRSQVPCSHPPICRNCQGAHYADDHACAFARHRYNKAWFLENHPTIA